MYKVAICDDDSLQVSNYFVRVNSGTMINLNHISSLNQNDVTMINGNCIAISRSRKKAVRTAYSHFIERSFGL